MNRLEKKCVIATAGFHLLLLLILILCPAFFNQEPKTDNLIPLKIIPPAAVDIALSTGVAHPKPPPTAPPQPVVTPPVAVPEPPKPVVTPPEPVQPPKPEIVRQPTPKPEEAETPDEKVTDDPTPLPKPKPKITISLTPVIKKVPKTHPQVTTQDDTADDERLAREDEKKRKQLIKQAMNSLRNNFTTSTEIETIGDSTTSQANYGQIVKSIYENAWVPPNNADNDEASPKVHVVIARDGSVISAELIEPSGDAGVDASVLRVLKRVKFIQPFPSGSTDKERSYNINFNLKAKRMLG
jgi:protein TonB